MVVLLGHHPVVGGDLHEAAALGQEFGDRGGVVLAHLVVEQDRAGRLDRAGEHLGRGHGVRLGPLGVAAGRAAAGGDDHHVGLLGADRLFGGGRVQAQVDAELGDLGD